MSLSCHLTEFGDLCGGSGLFARLEVPATPAEEAAPPPPLLAAGLAAPASPGRGTPGGTLSGEAGETAAEETHSTAEESPLDPPTKGAPEELCFECRGPFSSFKRPQQCAQCQQAFCGECATVDRQQFAMCHYCKALGQRGGLGRLGSGRHLPPGASSLLLLSVPSEADRSFSSEGEGEDDDQDAFVTDPSMPPDVEAPAVPPGPGSPTSLDTDGSYHDAPQSPPGPAADHAGLPNVSFRLGGSGGRRGCCPSGGSPAPDWPAPTTDAEALVMLLVIAKQHLRRLVDGLLRNLHTVPQYSPCAEPESPEGLRIQDVEGWTAILVRLAWEAAQKVKLDPGGADGMDLRQFVKVKAVAGGEKEDSEYVDGVLFRKNVAIRKMPTELASPRLLLLRGCVEHERTSSITTFDASLNQQDAALARVFEAIQGLSPSVVLVEKSVNEYVRRRMAEENMALAINVRSSILARVARCTGAQVISGVGVLQAANVKAPSPIGTCQQFCTRRVGDQTFMCLKGCLPSRGCTLVLRGAPLPVLKCLKNLLSFAVFTAHSLTSEAHYYWDSHAVMPPRPYIPFPSRPPAAAGKGSPLTGSEDSEVESGRTSPIAAAPATRSATGGKAKSVCFTAAQPMAIEAPTADPADEFPLDLLSVSMDVEFLPAPGEVRRSFFSSSDTDTDYKVSFNDAYHQPLRHQSLAVLHTVVYQNAEAQGAAEPPQPKSGAPEDIPVMHDHVETDFTVESSLLLLRYYDPNTNDLTLGQFLNAVLCDERLLLRERTSTQYLVAQRQYAHHQGRLLVTLERSAENFGERPVTWIHCKVCDAPASPRKPLSDETLLFSFGKWLEVAFYNRTAASRRCGHDLHSCTTRVYGLQHARITVSYVAISVYDIVPPSAILTYDTALSARFMEEEWQEVRCAAEEGFHIIRHMLDTQGQSLPPGLSLYAAKKALLAEQQQRTMAELHRLHGAGDVMALNDFRLRLYRLIIKWDDHLTDLVNYDDEALLAESPDTVTQLQSPMLKFPKAIVEPEAMGSHCEISLSRSDEDLAELGLSRVDGEPTRDDSTVFLRSMTSIDSMRNCEADPAVSRSPPIEASASHCVEALARLAPAECVSPTHSSTTLTFANRDDVTFDTVRRRSGRAGLKKGPVVPAPLTLCNQRTQLGLKQPANGRVVIVRDDEPSSIIAYTLCSEEYEAVNPFNNIHTTPTEALPAARNFSKSALTLLLSKDKLHVEFKWAADAGTRGEGSRAQLAVTVYYATQFAALRRLYCAGDDLPIIQSLARCIPFKPTGGKSRASFIKTADDRFVLKRISSVERKHMLSTARKYFEHMYKVYHRDRLKRLRSTLVKILGFFKVSVTKPASGFAYNREEVHYYVLMENLIYGHEGVKVIYDLKGSRRNRYQNEKSAVQLDENLIEMLQSEEGTGLFVKESSKERLNICIHNDTVMLSKINVMDYSLLVAVDEEKGQLVVGIIDYIRQYTLDKQVEYVVKSARVMGGKGKQPTVVPTQDYKSRFRQAMQHYFSVVPTKASMWMMLLGNYQTLVDPLLKQELIRCTSTLHCRGDPEAELPKKAP
eukprot:EG_transcript_337